jgi:hypothetical protein
MGIAKGVSALPRRVRPPQRDPPTSATTGNNWLRSIRHYTPGGESVAADASRQAAAQRVATLRHRSDLRSRAGLGDRAKRWLVQMSSRAVPSRPTWSESRWSKKTLVPVSIAAMAVIWSAGDECSVWTHQVGSGRADRSVPPRPAAEVLIILWLLRSGRRVQRAVNPPC